MEKIPLLNMTREINCMGIPDVLFEIISKEIRQNFVPKPLSESSQNLETSNNSRV